MNPQSNIAGAINAAHEKVEQSKRQGVKYAIECGRLLAELGHLLCEIDDLFDRKGGNQRLAHRAEALLDLRKGGGKFPDLGFDLLHAGGEALDRRAEANINV